MPRLQKGCLCLISAEPLNNDVILLLVSGLGYGIISGLFAMVNVLADITGPGTLGLHGDPQNFLIVSGKCFNFGLGLGLGLGVRVSSSYFSHFLSLFLFSPIFKLKPPIFPIF